MGTVTKGALNSASFKVSNADDKSRKYAIGANATIGQQSFKGLDSGTVDSLETGNRLGDFSISESNMYITLYGEGVNRREAVEAVMAFYDECVELKME